jgi:glycosyltransferase involved in cell wall biosynthesis
VTVPDRPLRLMFVVPDLGTGGAERHVTTLAPQLDPGRFAPSVICIGGEGALFPEIVRAGIPATALQRTKHQAVLALLDLIREMRRQRPDLVIVRGYNAEMLGRTAAVLTGVPHQIIWVHHCSEPESRASVRRIADRILDRHTDAYFGVARAQIPFLVGELGYREDKIRIIHNGVDPGRFSTSDVRSAITDLGIDPKAPVIGILASLTSVKDHATLLHAARRVADDVPDLVVLIVGDGPLRETLVRLAADLGLGDRVIFTGVRSDVGEILRGLTVFTLCSSTECFPMAVLEAMAAGRAIVCTGVGGVVEMITDSVSGYLVPPSDPVALAARLTALIQDPQLRQRFGLAARSSVEREFSLRASVDSAAEELGKVAGVALPRPVRRPVRLTVVLDSVFVGGVEILLLDLFRNFDPRVVRPRLVCLREGGSLAENFRAEGFAVEVLDRKGRFDVRTLPRLVRSFRRDRTDAVLVSHHHRAALALGRLAAKVAGVPINLVAAHDMDLTSVGKRVLPKWAVRTMAVSDALVLLTPSQGRYLRTEEGVARHPWEAVFEVVIPNGIEMPARAGTAEREQARAALGVGPDDFVVGIVARLSKQKAHQVLFDAVARCLPEVPNVRVVVIGDGERSAELRQYAQQVGIASRTKFMGTRRDVPFLLPGIDVSCLSSVHEGVPIALLEAMAAGVPVVATDVGSVRDIVEDGEQGFVIPVNDPVTFADRLRLLAREPEVRARLGKCARDRAEVEFGIERTARGYESLLTELLMRSSTDSGISLG